MDSNLMTFWKRQNQRKDKKWLLEVKGLEGINRQGTEYS